MANKKISQLTAASALTGTELLACVNTAGTWSLLNDASHTFFNLTSATTVSDRLRINYPTVGKVISMIVTPDETYAQNGISMGASVGLSFANVIMYRDNIVDYISWNGSSFTSSTGQVTSISYSAGLITLNHGTLISPDTTQLGIEGRAVMLGHHWGQVQLSFKF